MLLRLHAKVGLIKVFVEIYCTISNEYSLFIILLTSNALSIVKVYLVVGYPACIPRFS